MLDDLDIQSLNETPYFLKLQLFLYTQCKPLLQAVKELYKFLGIVRKRGQGYSMAVINSASKRGFCFITKTFVGVRSVLYRRDFATGQGSRIIMNGSDGILLQDVVRQLSKFASTKLAEKWDNVGLLVEPSGSHKIKRILLTNDLTQSVLDEALAKSVEMIISYHPPIFVPLKRLSQGNWKERIIMKCIENRIAIYSPHTSYDAVKGGVNDWLIECFGPGEIQPIIQSNDTSFTRERPNSCSKLTLRCNGKQPSPSDDTGGLSQIQSMNGVLSVECKDLYPGVFTMEIVVVPSEVALAKVYDYAQKSLKPSCIEVTKLENLPLPGYGMGRIIQLKEQITLENAVNLVKEHLGIPFVRLALARKAALSKKISSVAVCAGSGGSVLKGVSADLYLTGELSHHEVLHAVESGTSVILCEHSNTERGFLKTLVPIMKEWFRDCITVEVSLKDKDPLCIV